MNSISYTQSSYNPLLSQNDSNIQNTIKNSYSQEVQENIALLNSFKSENEKMSRQIEQINQEKKILENIISQNQSLLQSQHQKLQSDKQKYQKEIKSLKESLKSSIKQQKSSQISEISEKTTNQFPKNPPQISKNQSCVSTVKKTNKKHEKENSAPNIINKNKNIQQQQQQKQKQKLPIQKRLKTDMDETMASRSNFDKFFSNASTVTQPSRITKKQSKKDPKRPQFQKQTPKQQYQYLGLQKIFSFYIEDFFNSIQKNYTKNNQIIDKAYQKSKDMAKSLQQKRCETTPRRLKSPEKPKEQPSPLLEEINQMMGTIQKECEISFNNLLSYTKDLEQQIIENNVIILNLEKKNLIQFEESLSFQKNLKEFYDQKLFDLETKQREQKLLSQQKSPLVKQILTCEDFYEFSEQKPSYPLQQETKQEEENEIEMEIGNTDKLGKYIDIFYQMQAEFFGKNHQKIMKTMQNQKYEDLEFSSLFSYEENQISTQNPSENLYQQIYIFIYETIQNYEHQKQKKSIEECKSIWVNVENQLSKMRKSQTPHLSSSYENQLKNLNIEQLQEEFITQNFEEDNNNNQFFSLQQTEYNQEPGVRISQGIISKLEEIQLQVEEDQLEFQKLSEKFLEDLNKIIQKIADFFNFQTEKLQEFSVSDQIKKKFDLLEVYLEEIGKIADKNQQFEQKLSKISFLGNHLQNTILDNNNMSQSSLKESQQKLNDHMKNNFSINFDLVKELFDRINKEDNIEYTNSLSLLQSIEPEYQEFMKHYLFTRYFVKFVMNFVQYTDYILSFQSNKTTSNQKEKDKENQFLLEEIDKFFQKNGVKEHSNSEISKLVHSFLKYYCQVQSTLLTN